MYENAKQAMSTQGMIPVPGTPRDTREGMIVLYPEIELRLVGQTARAALLQDGTVLISIGCQTMTLESWREHLDVLIAQNYGYEPERHLRMTEAFETLEKAIEIQWAEQRKEIRDSLTGMRQLYERQAEEYRAGVERGAKAQEREGYVGLRRAGEVYPGERGYDGGE